ncbi:hypothetical protein MNBD_BACTEROID01-1653 [hydrothermal vent metagenome]|uniref:Glycosyl transferase family 1 domain-containing protein n=1 Tax=hydrothermal vent metagenome TaxID=652676 RepID=A0A3B0TYN6_9ZZZZ
MHKQLKIAILTASSPFYAAGILAYDLKNLLQEAGHDCIIMANTYFENNKKDIIVFPSKLGNFIKRIDEAVKRRINKEVPTDDNYYMFGLKQRAYKPMHHRIISRLPFKPDYFIYLFPQYFLNAKDLYLLNKKTGVPILWFMMDMAAMTGGCHYAWDCEGYTKSCGCCPGIYSKNPKDQTNNNFNFKKKYIEKTNITPIAASEWQYGQLKKSNIFKNKKKYKVFEPINEAHYKPADKSTARKELNLPLEKKILFFGATSVNDKRKGYSLLLKALLLLDKKLNREEKQGIHLAIAGAANNDFDFDLPFTYTHMGYFTHEGLPRAYQAADIFVCPSIQDSGPLMVNHSIMCGTPVVAFEMGVATDIVHSGSTGYRAKLNDTGDLCKGIESILKLDEGAYLQMSKACIEAGKEYISNESILNQLNEVFHGV